MDGIKGWLLGIAFAALTGGIAYMLSPKGATDKCVRIAVSLFILVSVFSPFVGGNVISIGGAFGDIENGGELNESLYEQIADNVSAAVTVKTKEVLKQYGLEDCGIEVKTTFSDGVVYAEKITVYSNTGYGGCEKAIGSEITKKTGTEDVVLE